MHDTSQKFPYTKSKSTFPLPVLRSIKQGFKEYVVQDAATSTHIAELREKVETFSKRFSMPGFDDK